MRHLSPRHLDIPALVNSLAVAALVGLLASSSACTLWQRESSYYADELTELLEQRTETIEACYDDYLESTDPKAQGTLVLDFEVAAKTGKLGQLEVVDQASDVPAPLAACVTDNIADLKLEPVDVNTGDATVAWEFALGSRKKPPADPFANVQQGVLGCYAKHLREVDREATGTLEIDYAFDREQGRIARLELVAAGTSVPASVAACAKGVLETAFIDPSKLEHRNAEGRRSFGFAFRPYVPPS